MNSLLADEYALFTKTLNFHWNVTGPRFYSVHEFLEGHYKRLIGMIDDLAERIREIGFMPMGTMTEFCKNSRIEERPGVSPETSHMIAELLADHHKVQGSIEEILNDKSAHDMRVSTEDFLISLLKTHEEMSWALKSHLS
jgi:starvation-inducible DNA-binding protein